MLLEYFYCYLILITFLSSSFMVLNFLMYLYIFTGFHQIHYIQLFHDPNIPKILMVIEI